MSELPQSYETSNSTLRQATVPFIILAMLPMVLPAQTYDVERLNGEEPIITKQMFLDVGASDYEGRKDL